MRLIFSLSFLLFFSCTGEKATMSEKQTNVPSNKVVFMGNSITEGWPSISPAFFENNANYICKGISGQTTSQMLLRFKSDVIEQTPKAVVILAGINDIAQNKGFVPVEQIADHIMMMAEYANQNNIKVVLCATLPAIDFPWRPGLEPAPKVVKLNNMIKEFATIKNYEFVDYHSAMKDNKEGLQVPKYAAPDDLVHPNAAGYEVMEGLLQPVILELLKS